MQSKTKRLAPATEPVQWMTGPACLVHIYPTGDALGARYPLGTIPWVLGRDTKCDIRLEDDSVSRRHALLQPQPDGYTVEDLQSTNGTFINGAKVTRAPIKHGDSLRVGIGLYRFLAGDDLEAGYKEEIYRLTIMDALTELPNKRYCLEFLGRSLGYGIRYRQPMALLVFDIDHFQALNEKLSHLAGDLALCNLAALLRRCVRREDLLARYEGGKFAVVLPGTNRAGALVLAERLRKLVEAQAFQYEGSPYHLTISIGIAALTGQDWQTSTEMLEQAQQQLKLAKQQGRNRVAG